MLAGNVQATAIQPNAAPRRCTVARWGASGTDVLVYVFCFDQAGAPVNTNFTLSYHRGRSVIGSLAPPKFFGHLASAAGGPTNDNSQLGVGVNTIAPLAPAGRYLVTFKQLGQKETHAQVTAQGTGPNYCNLTQPWSYAVDAPVDVICFDNTGMPAPYQVLVAFTSRIPAGRRCPPVHRTGGHSALWGDAGRHRPPARHAPGVSPPRPTRGPGAARDLRFPAGSASVVGPSPRRPSHEQHEGEPMGPKASIRDVAAAAGVSVTTVSHVLNNKSGTRVSAQTRERVEAVARQLGYAANGLARGLRLQRSYALGLLGDVIAATGQAGRLILGAQESASARGWVLLLTTGRDPAPRLQPDDGRRRGQATNWRTSGKPRPTHGLDRYRLWDSAVFVVRLRQGGSRWQRGARAAQHPAGRLRGRGGGPWPPSPPESSRGCRPLLRRIPLRGASECRSAWRPLGGHASPISRRGASLRDTTP